MKFWEKTKEMTMLEAPHTAYQVLTKEEFAQAKDVILLEVTHEDSYTLVKTLSTATGMKDQVLRKPLFIVGKSRDQALIEARMKVDVGEANYQEYYNAVNKVAELENQVVGVKQDMALKDEMMKDLTDRMAFIKSHLGTNSFLNLMSQYDANKAAKKL